jgi:hypothetical protein
MYMTHSVHAHFGTCSGGARTTTPTCRSALACWPGLMCVDGGDRTYNAGLPAGHTIHALEGVPMLCFPCLSEVQLSQRKLAEMAVTVYHGNALCMRHLNLIRGLPTDFGEQPTSAVPIAGGTTSGPPVPGAPIAGPVAVQPAVAASLRTGHAPCTNCDEWSEVHYCEPGSPHCGCGAHLINGECEAVLQAEGRLADTIAALAPRPTL